MYRWRRIGGLHFLAILSGDRFLAVLAVLFVGGFVIGVVRVAAGRDAGQAELVDQFVFGLLRLALGRRARLSRGVRLFRIASLAFFRFLGLGAGRLVAIVRNIAFIA